MTFTGKASFTFPDGKVYEGDFENDLPNGVGCMTFPNGDTYDGHWKNGKMEGHGTYRFFDLRRDRFNGYYEGFFSDSQFDGWGKREYANKAKYCGRWQHGKKTGEGQLLFATGDSFSGIWEEDVLKEGLVSFADGSTYNGHLKDYRFMGFGTYMRPDGTILQGKWNGAVLVKGVEISANGDINEIEENKKLW